VCDRCGGDITSLETNDQNEPYLIFRRNQQRPSQLFVHNFKYLGIVLALAGDRALAEARSCVEGITIQLLRHFNYIVCSAYVETGDIPVCRCFYVFIFLKLTF